MSKLTRTKQGQIKAKIKELMEREFELKIINSESHANYKDYDFDWFDLSTSFHLLLKYKGLTNSPAFGCLQPLNQHNYTLFTVATLLRGIVNGERGIHHDVVEKCINNSKYRDEILENIKIPRYNPKKDGYLDTLVTSDFYTVSVYYSAISTDPSNKIAIIRTLLGDMPIKVKPTDSELKFKLRDVLTTLTMLFISSEFNMMSQERESAVKRHKTDGEHQEIKDSVFEKSDLKTRIILLASSNAKLLYQRADSIELNRNNNLAYGFIADEYYVSTCEEVIAEGEKFGYTYEDKLQFAAALKQAIKIGEEHDPFPVLSTIADRAERINRLKEIELNRTLSSLSQLQLPPDYTPRMYGSTGLSRALFLAQFGTGDNIHNLDPSLASIDEKLEKLEMMYLDTCKNRKDIIYTEDFGLIEGFSNTLLLQETINFFMENGFLDRLSLYGIQIGGEFQHNIFEIVNHDDSRTQIAIIFKSTKFIGLVKDNMH